MSITATRSRERVLALSALCAAMLVAAVAALAFGSVPLAAGAIAHAATHPNETGLTATIFWQLRLPRVCIAACVGAGLGVAGVMLQALFRNPLVDPYVSGVSAGAALAAVLGIAAGVSFALVPPVAFVGGLLCAAVVVALAGGGGSSGKIGRA